MSQKSSGYKRMDGDRYFTPAWPIDALCLVEVFHGKIYDPGAGDGLMMDALATHGYEVQGFDVERPSYPRPDIGILDFLRAAGDCDNICANPPYGVQGRLAVRFIEKSLDVTRARCGKVAMLLRVDFDSAGTRSHVFANHPAFAAKYTLTKRIRWANLDQKKSGPTENHAWFLWDWSKRRDAARTYGYLP